MSDIRKYINLVEQELKEWPFSKKPEPDISNRVFGRPEPKTIQKPNDFVKPTANAVRKPHDYDHPDAEHARQFSSAETYATDPSNNQYMPIHSYDSVDIKRNAQIEADKLKIKWNRLKTQGYI